MSDAIFPDCSSAAICCIATKLTNYWWEGSTSTAIPPASNGTGQHNKIRAITFNSLSSIYILAKRISTNTLIMNGMP
jgi:hypothetical protein